MSTERLSTPPLPRSRQMVPIPTPPPFWATPGLFQPTIGDPLWLHDGTEVLVSSSDPRHLLRPHGGTNWAAIRRAVDWPETLRRRTLRAWQRHETSPHADRLPDGWTGTPVPEQPEQWWMTAPDGSRYLCDTRKEGPTIDLLTRARRLPDQVNLAHAAIGGTIRCELCGRLHRTDRPRSWGPCADTVVRYWQHQLLHLVPQYTSTKDPWTLTWEPPPVEDRYRGRLAWHHHQGKALPTLTETTHQLLQTLKGLGGEFQFPLPTPDLVAIPDPIPAFGQREQVKLDQWHTACQRWTQKTAHLLHQLETLLPGPAPIGPPRYHRSGPPQAPPVCLHIQPASLQNNGFASSTITEVDRVVGILGAPIHVAAEPNIDSAHAIRLYRTITRNDIPDLPPPHVFYANMMPGSAYDQHEVQNWIDRIQVWLQTRFHAAVLMQPSPVIPGYYLLNVEALGLDSEFWSHAELHLSNLRVLLCSCYVPRLAPMDNLLSLPPSHA